MPTTVTTTTNTTTTSTRDGQKLLVSSQANTQQVGNFVTDVSLSPYIAPTIISFMAVNMRPNTRLYVFFDGMNVSQYCAPGIFPSGSVDTSRYTTVAKNGNWGDAIYSDSSGRVAGQFSVPATTFKTGDRTLQITDVTSLSLGGSAMSTISAATFTASNLNVTKQGVTLTTVNPEISYISGSETVVNTAVISNTTIIPDPPPPAPPPVYNPPPVELWIPVSNPGGDTGGGSDPLAQTLTISSGQFAGVFATSLEIYFSRKSQVSNNGVTVYLCEMRSGLPNPNFILPFSRVHLPLANVNISTDASSSTKFTFDSPVFLNKSTSYAFVVKPDANDPDYAIYSANLGDLDIATSQQVYTQPAIGTAFLGATQATWTPLSTEYLKFKLNRASFQYGQGDAYFNNANTDYLYITGLSYVNTSVALLPGDYVFNSTSNAAATANTSRVGLFDYYDTVRNIVYIENSTGNFPTTNSMIQVHRFANASLASSPNTTTMIAYANTIGLYNPIVDAIVPQFATMTPSGTGLVFDYLGTSNAYSVESTGQYVLPGTEREFYDQERVIASVSKEVASMASAKSVRMHANLTSTTQFLSPVIDLVRSQQLAIANKIDPVTFNYNEYYNYSNAQSKYVSKIITLASGQDAEDLQVSLTAHRPPNTDIQVWVKYLNGEDADPMSTKTWTPMINRGSAVYSDPSNPYDFQEFNFVTAAAFSAFNTTGTITANNSNSTVTGVGTAFGTEVEVGWWINMAPNNTFTEGARQVQSITNTTSLILNSPFGAAAGYTAQSYYVVAPPTVAYSSVNTATAITGTVAVTTTNNAIIGTGTNFTSVFGPGSIIKTANDQQVVVSVVNTTYLTVGEPWSNTVSGATAYIVTPTGITYLNSNSAMYNTFKQFQIKIILQSGDTSKVPLLDDLRVLALQL